MVQDITSLQQYQDAVRISSLLPFPCPACTLTEHSCFANPHPTPTTHIAQSGYVSITFLAQWQILPIPPPIVEQNPQITFYTVNCGLVDEVRAAADEEWVGVLEVSR